MLHWSIEDVENYEELIGEEHLDEQAITQAIVLLTMSIPYSKITQDNYLDVATAIMLEEKINGARLKEPIGENYWQERPITLADVRRRIGLWTNASSKHLNRQKFLHNLYKAQRDELALRDKREKEDGRDGR